MSELNVLVLGGLNCGKGAILASMLYSLRNEVLSHYFVSTDETSLQSVQYSLTYRVSTMRNFLSEPNTKTFLVRTFTSPYWEFYKLKIQLPGADSSMYINFHVIPGSAYRQLDIHRDEIIKQVKQCDVFIIAIDTPYMMESVNPSNTLCNEFVNEEVNRAQEIHQLLTYIYNGEDGKMVIFCPVKCEKWFHEGDIGIVCDRVRDMYSSTISMCSSMKTDLSIIAVLTMGNVEFVEQKEALWLQKASAPKRHIQCCKITSKYVRTASGDTHILKEGDVLSEDSEALLRGMYLRKPYSWFKIRYHNDSRLNGYMPLNCEQLPLHIIRFMLRKLHDEIQHPKPYVFNLFPPKKKTEEIFGNIDTNKLRDIINEMQEMGIFKDEESLGIVHIKNIYC